MVATAYYNFLVATIATVPVFVTRARSSGKSSNANWFWNEKKLQISDCGGASFQSRGFF